MLTITNEDNMALMARYPDKHFDLAIVDPPYGINAPNMSATPNQRRSGLQRLNGSGSKLKNRVLNTAKKIEWDNAIPDQEYFKELFRVSKNQIIWGGNYFPLPPTRCVICWDKCQPWENFSQIELAWTSFDRPAPLFRFDNRTGGKIHPTQKPTDLYRWVLNKYAQCSECGGSGETPSNSIDCDVQTCKACKGNAPKILDTHLGSGSIAIACHDYGYDLTACELDPEYYAAAMKRIDNHVAQQNLFL